MFPFRKPRVLKVCSIFQISLVKVFIITFIAKKLLYKASTISKVNQISPNLGIIASQSTLSKRRLRSFCNKSLISVVDTVT